MGEYVRDEIDELCNLYCNHEGVLACLCVRTHGTTATDPASHAEFAIGCARVLAKNRCHVHGRGTAQCRYLRCYAKAPWRHAYLHSGFRQIPAVDQRTAA